MTIHPTPDDLPRLRLPRDVKEAIEIELLADELAELEEQRLLEPDDDPDVIDPKIEAGSRSSPSRERAINEIAFGSCLRPECTRGRRPPGPASHRTATCVTLTAKSQVEKCKWWCTWRKETL
jgi:hypothetical protein